MVRCIRPDYNRASTCPPDDSRRNRLWPLLEPPSMPRSGLAPAWTALVLVSAAVIPVAPAAEPTLSDPWIESRLPEIVHLYEHFHRHPELSFREVTTARRLAEELRIAGAEVTTGVGGLGIVGVMKN